MKNIIQFIMFILLSSVISYASCYDKYKCQPKSEIDTETKQRIYSLKNCRLPNMDTMPINAVDVFESDGTLKTYFGTGETVCDVLGWMDEGAKKFSVVGGLFLV